MLLMASVLAGCSVDGNQRADQVCNTVVGQSVARAKDEVCMSNIRQVRMSIQALSTNADDQKPESLEALKLPATMIECPIGHEPYTYDPATGAVKCPHAGHGKY